jgi:ubiquitin-protein ligase
MMSKNKNEETILIDLENMIEKTNLKIEYRDVYHIFNKPNTFTKYQVNFDMLHIDTSKSVLDVGIPKQLLLSESQIKKILINEIKKINSNKLYKHYIFPSDNNICKLNIRLFLSNTSILGQQLEHKDCESNYIELQIILDPKGFPFIAPKIEYIKPTATISFMLSLMDLDILKQSNWVQMSLEVFILDLVKQLEQIKHNYILYDKSCILDQEILKLILLSKDYIYDKIDIQLTMQHTKANNKSLSSGTGYGNDDSKLWDINKYIQERDNTFKQQTDCLDNIDKIIKDDMKISIDQIDILTKYIINITMNITLLEINKNMEFYSKIIRILNRIINYINKDMLNIIICNLESLKEDINYIIQNNIDSGKPDLFSAYVILHKILNHYSLKNKGENILVEEIIISSDIKEEYCNNMKKLQFGHYDLDHNHLFYEKKDNKIESKTIMRILSEISTLKKNLPLNWGSTIWVRVSKSHLNMLIVLISGPKDTPYENGLFEFHVYLPTDYPNSPPQVLLKTTGNNSVRFNPNLYASGKVCLSLLGTWSGAAGESWNKDTSSLLQVLVSIQSLIFVDDPYFNEPGYERYIKQKTYQAMSQKYNEEKRPHTINLAMIDMMIKPIVHFEDVIKEHFSKKKDEIINKTLIWEQSNNLLKPIRDKLLECYN